MGEVEGAEIVDGGDSDEGRGGEGGHCWLWGWWGSGHLGTARVAARNLSHFY